jgi:hypothetical protein
MRRKGRSEEKKNEEERHEGRKKGMKTERKERGQKETQRGIKLLTILVVVSVCNNYAHSIVEHCDRGFESRKFMDVYPRFLCCFMLYK